MSKFNVFVNNPIGMFSDNQDELKKASEIILNNLRRKLEDVGFNNVTLDELVTRHDTSALSDHQIELIKRQPIYIAEHYIARNILMDTHLQNAFTPVFNIKPNLGAYQFCHGGKCAQFVFNVIGLMNSGKTFIKGVLQRLLEVMVPGAEIVFCESRYTDVTVKKELMLDPDSPRLVSIEQKSDPICIGDIPRERLLVNGDRAHSVNL